MKSVPPEDQKFRIIERNYSGDATPLAEVLVMIYDWSVERRQPLAQKTDPGTARGSGGSTPA